MVLLSLQHLPRKKHFSQYLQLVLFMTLSGLAVFRVQLFPIDYTKRVCLCVCVYGLNAVQERSQLFLVIVMKVEVRYLDCG